MDSKMSTDENGDLESGDDSVPLLASEDDHDVRQACKSSRMNMESLVNAEHSDQHVNDRMEELAEEIKWFDLKEDETLTQLPHPLLEGFQQRDIVLQPPGIPFFTNKCHCLYTEETLVWPFQESAVHRWPKLHPSKVKKYIREGIFQREYSSKTLVKLMMKYLFHLICCTTDAELLHSTYNTLCYLIETNQLEVNICQDLYFALANLGADVSKLGKDVTNFKSPVIPHPTGEPSDATKPFGLFKETIMLVLQFQSTVLAKSKIYSDDDVDDLINTFLAIGCDPKMIDCGLDSHISSCIQHSLSLYSSDQIFYQRVQGLVEKITTYCAFHHHTVSHVCCMYLLPSQRGKILKSSMAFLQAQIDLRKEEKILLDIVDVEDVAELVEKQLHVICEEEDGYILHSVMKLLDCCIGFEPLTATQKNHLRRICDLLTPVVNSRRDKLDDMNPTLFRFYSTLVIAKWRRKVGLAGRQQTLHELHVNSVKKSGELLLPDVTP